DQQADARLRITSGGYRTDAERLDVLQPLADSMRQAQTEGSSALRDLDEAKTAQGNADTYRRRVAAEALPLEDPQRESDQNKATSYEEKAQEALRSAAKHQA